MGTGFMVSLMSSSITGLPCRLLVSIVSSPLLGFYLKLSEVMINEYKMNQTMSLLMKIFVLNFEEFAACKCTQYTMNLELRPST